MERETVLQSVEQTFSKDHGTGSNTINPRSGIVRPPGERVTVLCKSAHSIGTKTIEMKKRTSEPPAAPNSPPTSAHPPGTGSEPVDRMYAILMFAIPFSRPDETRPDGEACFENHGHFLHVYEGHEKCKWQSTGPTYIPTGVVQDEYARCGYKIEDKGGNRGRRRNSREKIPMIVRGRHDVGRIMSVVDAKFRRNTSQQQ